MLPFSKEKEIRRETELEKTVLAETIETLARLQKHKVKQFEASAILFQKRTISVETYSLLEMNACGTVSASRKVLGLSKPQVTRSPSAGFAGPRSVHQSALHFLPLLIRQAKENCSIFVLFRPQIKRNQFLSVFKKGSTRPPTRNTETPPRALAGRKACLCLCF